MIKYVKVGGEFVPEHIYLAAKGYWDVCLRNDFCQGSITIELEDIGLFEIESWGSLMDLKDDKIASKKVLNVYFNPEALVDRVEPQRLLKSLGYKHTLDGGWQLCPTVEKQVEDI